MRTLLIVMLLCCIATVAEAKHRKHHQQREDYDLILKREALVHDFGDVVTVYYGPK